MWRIGQFKEFETEVRLYEAFRNSTDIYYSGNRLQILTTDLILARDAFRGVRELELDEMLLSWQDISLLVGQFESLTSLHVSSNGFTNLPSSLPTSTLRSLTLEYNEFNTLSVLSPLSELRSLETLHLKGNNISKITGEDKKPVFGAKLRYVDLSYNSVSSWDFVDDLIGTFPGLTALRFSHNPLYDTISKESGSATSIEEAYMLTLARLRNLKTLNFSNISVLERTNAEMFYLSRISKAMAEVPESEEHTVTSKHKRYVELCEIYGAPTVVRKATGTVDPDFLEARLIKFTFYIPTGQIAGKETAIIKEQKIPKGFDVYRVKGIVGRMFDLRPLGLRLIWETGDWDPVARYEEEGEVSCDDKDDDIVEKVVDAETAARREQGRWTRREVEFEDGTRQVGFFVDGMEAKVRVEMR